MIKDVLRRLLKRVSRANVAADLAPQGMFLSLASASNERAGAVLSLQPSEDKSGLLGEILVQEHRDPGYAPDEHNTMCVTVCPVSGTLFNRSAVLDILGADWLKSSGGPEIFGLPPGETAWTYLRAGGVPEEYAQIKVAWPLSATYRPDWATPNIETLQGYRNDLRRELPRLRAVEVAASMTVERAAYRARELASLKETCDRTATIVLAADEGRPFSGRTIWDTMLCLGLSWGDMDLFHWENHASVGDDQHFSVWTTTPPGYFFPEEIAADRVLVHDLVFGYRIPRCAAPLEVFNAMVAAAEYAKQRLGGQLLTADNRPFGRDAALEEISSVIGELRAKGFVPGESRTLRIF